MEGGQPIPDNRSAQGGRISQRATPWGWQGQSPQCRKHWENVGQTQGPQLQSVDEGHAAVDSGWTQSSGQGPFLASHSRFLPPQSLPPSSLAPRMVSLVLLRGRMGGDNVVRSGQ